MVVLALLTLLAIVGLSLVLYADAAASASRSFREAESDERPDVNPELLFSYFLGQLIYDTPDDEKGIYSCLRGHGLARNMYGLNYTKAAGGPIQYVDDNGVPLNQVPFNGTGRLHTKFPVLGVAAPGSFNNPLQPGIDDYKLINYTYFKQDGFLRDPERFGARIVQGPLSQYRPYRTDPTYQAEQPGYYVGGFNAPYTYPDLNNLFLAAVRAGKAKLANGHELPAGTVLIPSFHRPWLFRDSKRTAKDRVGAFDRNNPNWTNKEGKYLLLRPRPFDQKRSPDDPERFPYPEDEGGDVKNLIGSPGYYDPYTRRLHNNDSIWLDLDFPVLVTADGRKFKALFAPLILDLDNRVNLNVHGNLRGTARADHASNQGWGPWEVSIKRVLDASPPEWQALFQSTTGPTERYGRDPFPHSAPVPATAAPYPKVYAPIDFDGSNQDKNGEPSGPLVLAPGPGSKAVPYQSFPDPPPGYSFGSKLETERVRHPNLFNPFAPTRPDRSLALSNLEALLRYGDTGSPTFTSEILRACPQNFADRSDPAAARRRGQVTLRSFDLDRPGITPWFWPGVNGAGYNGLTPSLAAFPCGGSVASPPFPPGFHPSPDSDFGPDWRGAARLGSLRRLDLNRYLPDYPKPMGDGVIVDVEQFQVAQRARQYMAAEIFEVLWRVTGTGDPAQIVSPPRSDSDPNVRRWNAMRALAQLAVNIVDFIDSDDYLTPFNWWSPPPGQNNVPAGEWVFGTELPRVVLNEAYVQYNNDLNTLGPRAGGYSATVWVELLNPLLEDPELPDQGAVKLAVAGPSGTISAYQLILCRPDAHLRSADNVRGQPNPGTILLRRWDDPQGQRAVVNFTEDAGAIPPSHKNYGGRGFYVVGPKGEHYPDPEEDPNLGSHASFRSAAMQYQVKAADGMLRPTILLRRLACPRLPENDDPTSPLYNPYVTMDTMENVPPNDGRRFDSNENGNNPGWQPMSERTSFGRRQPYAADKMVPQVPDQHPFGIPQPKHTLGRHNGSDLLNPGADPTLKLPFDWLVHLDRKLISPMELLHVSAFKPHELTQEFMKGPISFHHRTPWFDEDLPDPKTLSHRLYRAFEFLGTHNQTVGMMAVSTRSETAIPPPLPTSSAVTRSFTAQRFGTTATGGSWEIVEGSSLIIDKGQANEEVVRVQKIERTLPPNQAVFDAEFLRGHAAGFTITPTTISERIPGKININTVWDVEILMALCDPQAPSNAFTETQIGGGKTNVFTQLLNQRSKHGRPSPEDKPFRSVATGLYPAKEEVQFPGRSIDDTVLQVKANDPSKQRLFQVPVHPSHPYLQYQLLNKIFNHLTVRSNVFAVWITVGFFEVTDDSGRSAKLGAEMGRAENRHIRHRMFAIVDRSVLQHNPGPQAQFDPRATPSPGSSTGLVVPYLSIIE